MQLYVISQNSKSTHACGCSYSLILHNSTTTCWNWHLHIFIYPNRCMRSSPVFYEVGGCDPISHCTHVTDKSLSFTYYIKLAFILSSRNSSCVFMAENEWESVPVRSWQKQPLSLFSALSPNSGRFTRTDLFYQMVVVLLKTKADRLRKYRQESHLVWMRCCLCPTSVRFPEC